MHNDDASQKSELNTTMQDAMWRGHGGWEIALTPAILGFLGWLVDGWLGTTPFLTILGAVAGFFGSVVNQYTRYTNRMATLENERKRAREAAISPGAKRFSRTEVSA